MRFFRLYLFILSGISLLLSYAQMAAAASLSASGSYRCWSYNVSGGGGGNCRLFAPIVLKSDGTYSISSEKGTYTVSGDTIILSESKIRGAGTFLENGMKIRFEYDYNGWHHVITYLKEGGSSVSATQGHLEKPLRAAQVQDGRSAATETYFSRFPQGGASEVPVHLILQYPAKHGSLGSITTVDLVPEGQTVAHALYKPTAIAVWDRNTRVTASFHKATNKPKAGQKYTVYTSYAGDAVSVGTLDLTNVKEETTVTIHVGTGEIEQKTPVVKNPSDKPKENERSEYYGKPCRSDMAITFQPGCVPQTRPEPSKPNAGKPCDSILSLFWQDECIPEKNEKENERSEYYGKPCRSDMAITFQPGCVPQTRPEPSKLNAGKPCDPDLPRVLQEGCIDASKNENTRNSPKEPVRCHPNIPRYSQPGCIE